MNRKKDMNFFIKIYRSIVKPKTYVYFSNIKLHKCIIYFLCLCILSSILGSLRYVYDYNKFVTAINKEVNDGFPEFKFSNGEIEVNQSEPIILTEKSKYTIIVDTTGKLNENTLKDYERVILILKDKAFIKESKHRVDEMYFKVFKNLNFNKEELRQSIWKLRLFTIIIIILFIIGSTVMYLSLCFIVSFLGTIINGVFKAGIRYKTLFKISIFSITPSAILSTGIKLLGVKYINLYYLYIIISTIYLFIGIRQILIYEYKNKI
jgi:hypothetical protein